MGSISTGSSALGGAVKGSAGVTGVESRSRFDLRRADSTFGAGVGDGGRSSSNSMSMSSSIAYGSGTAVYFRLASFLCFRRKPRTFLGFLGMSVLPLALLFCFVLDLRLTEPRMPITFAAFVDILISVSVCGGDIIAASSSIEGRRDIVLGVADVRCDLDRDEGGGIPNIAPRPVEARVDFVRDGVLATLSDPDDLDMTSWFFDEGTRADFDRTKVGRLGRCSSTRSTIIA